MRLDAANLLSLLLCLYSSWSLAIYADEAYHVDYHHSLLGLPQPHTTFFHRPSSNSKASLLYTLSARSVIGAVNPKDGSVLWRQRLEDQAPNKTTPSLLRAGEGADTIVSAVNGLVQAWDAVDGRLAWYWHSSAGIKALEVLAGAEGDRDVVVLGEARTEQRIFRLSGHDGSVVWVHEDARYAC